MCDYSLHGIPNRLAKEGEALVVHRFYTGSKGLMSTTENLKPAEQPKKGLRQSLRHMRCIEEMIEDLDKEIAVRLKPYQQQMSLACTDRESSRTRQPASWRKREWT